MQNRIRFRFGVGLCSVSLAPLTLNDLIVYLCNRTVSSKYLFPNLLNHIKLVRWAVWAEQHAQSTCFLPQTSQEGIESTTT